MGLVDDWWTRVASPYSTTSSQSLTLNLQTLNRNASPLSPMGATSVALMSMSSPLSLSFEEAPSLPTFTLPRIVNGSKVFPGIKDLPAHIHQNFCNEFIHFVIKQVANSQSPWINPDVNALQAMYQLVYPVFPAQLWHSDAVYHLTITSLGVLHNHLAAAAITTIQRYLPRIFCKKRLQTIDSRAEYVEKLFRSDNDHPIIWQEYVEGDIQNHPEVGRYKTTRHGVFQSDPILKTLLSYYSSSGIMEPIPAEDPGLGNRLLGVLTLATTAVECAYKLYATGDFIEPTQQFNAESSGPRTVRYLDYIANDLGERHWKSIFLTLSSFSIQTEKEEAMHNGAPKGPHECVPLPPSDPPSPHGD